MVAPCCVCDKAVDEKNGDYIEAFDRVYHPDCFNCAVCSVCCEGVYCVVVDGRLLCEEHQDSVAVSHTCKGCQTEITKLRDGFLACGAWWHAQCLTCSVCESCIVSSGGDGGETQVADSKAAATAPKELDGFQRGGHIVCGDCTRLARSSASCPGCGDMIGADECFALGRGRAWHKDHFVCQECHMSLVGVPIKFDASSDPKLVFCEADFNKLNAKQCAHCSEMTTCFVEAMDRFWCLNHFTCHHCNIALAPASSQPSRKDGNSELEDQSAADAGEGVGGEGSASDEFTYFPYGGHPFCRKDFEKLHARRCGGCNLAILDKAFLALDKSWHRQCLRCCIDDCPTAELTDKVFTTPDGKLYCADHYQSLFQQWLCPECHGAVAGSYVDIAGKRVHLSCLRCSVCDGNDRNDNAVDEEASDVSRREEYMQLASGSIICKACCEKGDLDDGSMPLETAQAMNVVNVDVDTLESKFLALPEIDDDEMAIADGALEVALDPTVDAGVDISTVSNLSNVGDECTDGTHDGGSGTHGDHGGNDGEWCNNDWSEYVQPDSDDCIQCIDGEVKAASITKLIERCTHESIGDPRLVYILFLTHKAFVTSERLLYLLQRRFRYTACPRDLAMTATGRKTWLRTRAAPVQRRVLSCVGHWVRNIWTDFRDDAELQAALNAFVEEAQNRPRFGIAAVKAHGRRVAETVATCRVQSQAGQGRAVAGMGSIELDDVGGDRDCDDGDEWEEEDEEEEVCGVGLEEVAEFDVKGNVSGKSDNESSGDTHGADSPVAAAAGDKTAGHDHQGVCFVSKEGFLLKQKHGKNVKKRYVTLSCGVLTYAKSKTSKPLGTIPLCGVCIEYPAVPPNPKKSAKHTFALQQPGFSTFYFGSDLEDDAVSWVDAIRPSISAAWDKVDELPMRSRKHSQIKGRPPAPPTAMTQRATLPISIAEEPTTASTATATASASPATGATEASAGASGTPLSTRQGTSDTTKSQPHPTVTSVATSVAGKEAPVTSVVSAPSSGLGSGLGALTLDPTLAASQLALLDWQVYLDIVSCECLGQAWSKKDKAVRAPNILRFISRFNRTSGWVVTEFSRAGTMEEATQLLRRYILMAHACRMMNNFNGTMAIFAGLNNSAVHRLRPAWDALRKSDKRVFDEISEVLSQKNNYKAFRHELYNVCRPPSMPYLGVFLSDLVFIDDGNPSLIDPPSSSTSSSSSSSSTVATPPPPLINVNKQTMTASVIDKIRLLQTKPYAIKRVDAVSRYLEDFSPLDDEQCYKASLQLLPRK